MRFFYCILISSLILLSACDESRVYEKNIDFKGNDWYADSVARFPIEIKDQAVEYNMYVDVRNAISYPFANLYIKYNVLDSTGKSLNTKLLRLPLFDKKSGKPYGDGLGDIFDHRFSLIKGYRFPYQGKYSLEVIQYMRQDPLPFIMSVGVRVEKAQATTNNN
jgi:gliding motility-associated lipoprotein GldH